MTKPTLYIAGDSSVRSDGVLNGWGGPLHDLLSIPVFNNGVELMSARSYVRDQHWNEIAGKLSSGDFVLIQFGLCDPGTWGEGLDPVEGEGEETKVVSFRGKEEVVRTFSAYLRQMVDQSFEKGAIPIIASQVAVNPYCEALPNPNEPRSKYFEYSKNVAQEKNITFVDLWQPTKARYLSESPTTVLPYFELNEDIHTTAAGAAVVAGLFIDSLKQAEGAPEGKKLSVYVK